MRQPLCVRMPRLHRGDPLPFRAESLSPGLPGQEGDHSFDFPFDAAKAGAVLAEMRACGPDQAFAMIAAGAGIADAIKLRAEWGELAAFAGQKREGVRARRLQAEQAQKILLWRWLHEELLDEIVSLERKCGAGFSRLASCFLEGEEACEEGFAESPAPGASWRTVLANALFFLPPGCMILAEGDMAEDLAEILDFRPAPDVAARLGCPEALAGCLFGAMAPDSAVLGGARNGENASRFWLHWRN